MSRWSISELTFHSYPQLSNAHLPLYPERSQLYLLRCQEPSRQVVDRLALCGLDLLSGHHLQKFECLEHSPGICFVEREQISQSSESGMVWAVLITHTPGLPVFKGSI